MVKGCPPIPLLSRHRFGYNNGMVNKQGLLLVFACALLAVSCVSEPKLIRPKFVQRHYTYTVLFDPEQAATSPQLELAMSLLELRYPKEETEFFNEVLYPNGDINSYREWVVREQREKYRTGLAALERPQENLKSANWRYAETISIQNTENRGVVVEREYETYAGGAHGQVTKWYYVLDLDSLQQLKIDDFVEDFQGPAVRAIVYDELRAYSKLEKNQPLSKGIFWSDAPELTFNFFITPEGLGLHWDSAEIAPYVEGKIEIVIPWPRIRPLMLHSGMELLTKFDIYLFV